MKKYVSSRMIAIVAIAIFLMASNTPLIARAVLQTPTNWYAVSAGATQAQIQTAINNCRDGGGGTVYLPAGTYTITSPLTITTETGGAAAVNIRILGAVPITGHAGAGETIIKYNGSSETSAAFEITKSQNITLENLRITCATNKRLGIGIYQHRLTWSDSPAPTSLNIIDCGINASGGGAFTCGIKLGDANFDANCDHEYFENLWIQGATDDNGGTTNNYLDGTNSCGISIEASQVQNLYFRNINIDNCGTGILCLNGQLMICGGTFSNNVQPAQSTTQCMAYDNHGADVRDGSNQATGQGGGDFVFRTGFGAGHLIQGITSTNSYRFITGYLEDQGSTNPPTGNNALWQSDHPVACALVGCTVTGTVAPNASAISLRANGGPLTLYDCDFGGTGGTAQRIQVGQWTQGVCVASHCKFNHSTGTFYEIPFLGATTGYDSRFSMVACTGWNGSNYVSVPNTYTDQDDDRYADATMYYTAPRSIANEPAAGSSTIINLGASFTYNSEVYTAVSGWQEAVDNTPIIEAAAAKLQAENGGGIIWIPSGIWVVKSTIDIQDKSGVKIMGVGGRNGVVDDGTHPVNGSGIFWDGPSTGTGSTILKINRSQNIAFKGVYFATFAGEGQTGVDHVDNVIHISQTGTGGYNTANIWLEDTGTTFLSSNGPIRNKGVCDTFCRIGDGASTVNCSSVTLVRVGGSRIAQDTVLIDGASCTGINMMQVSTPQAKRFLHLSPSGGGFTAYVSGSGNNLWDWNLPYQSTYDDPIVIQLDNLTADSVFSMTELQDNYPTRCLRTATATVNGRKLSMYGVDDYFSSPYDDKKNIDFKFTGNSQLNIIGSGLGWVLNDDPQEPNDYYLTIPIKIAAANGAKIYTTGCLFDTYDANFPWTVSGSSFMQAMDARSIVRNFVGTWPYDRANWQHYSSTYGMYSLTPGAVAPGALFNITWACGSGDTSRTGDWVGIYADPGTDPATYISLVDLVNRRGQYVASGTTRDQLVAPTTAGNYQLRYYKNAGTMRCVYKRVLKVQ